MNNRSRATQDRIIQAAYKLFSEKGFSNTTTKEIADRAGVAELTLFRHFKSKPNILKQVLMQYSPVSHIDEAILQIEKMPLEKGLPGLTGILADHLEKNRNIIRMNIEKLPFDTELKKTVNPMRRKLLQRITRYFKSKLKGNTNLSKLPAEEIASTYLWFVFSSMVLFDNEKMDFIKTTPRRMCNVINVIFLNSLIQSKNN